MVSCDALFVASPDGTPYKAYADTCAGRQDPGTSVLHDRLPGDARHRPSARSLSGGAGPLLSGARPVLSERRGSATVSVVDDDAGPHPVVRASDADREAVVARLQKALGEGRIDLDEFGQRAAVVYDATTLAELDGVVADLPTDARPPVEIVGDAHAGGRLQRLRRHQAVGRFGSAEGVQGVRRHPDRPARAAHRRRPGRALPVARCSATWR